MIRKESERSNNIMSIRMPEEDRARIDQIRRYYFETTGELYTASEIIRALLRVEATRIEKEKGGEDNG